MSDQRTQVLVIGAGFGGCLIAAMLAKRGYDVVVIDKQKHPRFAIGESSTPIADRLLESIAVQYDLPELIPLARYGTARESNPLFSVGCKRGFSYFFHNPDERFQSDPNNSNQLLVAASSSDELADTHWYRQDVDWYFAQLAERVGVQVFEAIQSVNVCAESPWRIECVLESGTKADILADFIIDASGTASVMASQLAIPRSAVGMATCSRATFAHFENVRPWSDVLCELGIEQDVHPFDADLAAVHHVLKEGWMWQLRFDNGRTSLGFVDDMLEPMDAPISNDVGDSKLWFHQEGWETWRQRLSRYPSLMRQLESALPLAETHRSTGRMQFKLARSSGDHWVALPNTAGLVDPLHSSGIAHTLFGVNRIAIQFNGKDYPSTDQLAMISDSNRREIKLIDQMVACAYRCRDNFEAWSAACCLYFAAATSMEVEGGPEGQATMAEGGTGFLMANNGDWFERVRRALDLADHLSESRPVTDRSARQFGEQIEELIRPYNQVGLFASEIPNMYRYTAAR